MDTTGEGMKWREKGLNWTWSQDGSDRLVTGRKNLMIFCQNLVSADHRFNIRAERFDPTAQGWCSR